MHFYLCRWDDYTDPESGEQVIEPRGAANLRNQGQPWWTIDLRRTDRQDRAVGWCFLATPQAPPATTPTGIEYLGDDPAEVRESLIDLLQTQFPGALNKIRDEIPPAKRNLRGLLEWLLILRPDATGVNPVRTGRRVGNRLRIWLGDLLYDVAVPAGGATVTDDFNRADSVGNLGANWDNKDNYCNIDANEVQLGNTNADNHVTYIGAALDGADHYSQVDCKQTSTTYGCGPVARDQGAASGAYGYYGVYRRAGTEYRLSKVVNGTSTTIASNSSLGSQTADVYYTMRVEADGSTIRLLEDGVEKLSVTDTAITTGNYAGMRGYRTQDRQRLDNFEASDLGASGTAHTATINDSVLVADTATTAVTGGTPHTASEADLVGITDTVTASTAHVRTVNDAVGIDDTPDTQTLDVEHIENDPVGITDTTAVAVAYTRAIADTVGVTDEASTGGATAHVRTVNDAVGITDATSGGTAYVVTVADTVGITDEVARTQGHARAVDDALTATDMAGQGHAATRSVTDTVGLTDAATTVVAGADGVVVTDAISVTDTVAWSSAIHVAIADAIGITDVAVVPQAHTRSVADAVGISDATTTSDGLRVDTYTVIAAPTDRWGVGEPLERAFATVGAPTERVAAIAAPSQREFAPVGAPDEHPFMLVGEPGDRWGVAEPTDRWAVGEPVEDRA